MPLTIGVPQLGRMRFDGLFENVVRPRPDFRGPEKPSVAPPPPAEARPKRLLLVTRRWRSATTPQAGERVVCRYADGQDWYKGELGRVNVRLRTADVQYEDGDFEANVPLDRVLSCEGESGSWDYMVTGPPIDPDEQAPDGQAHP